MEKQLIELTKKLISISSASGHEKALANYLEDNIKGFGEITRNNNSITLKISGQNSKKLFILNGHIDTVPAANGWQTDPTTPVIESDKLIGLGSSDMKSGVAIMLYLAETFSKQKPPCDMLLMFVENEEIDGSGTKATLNLLGDSIKKYPQAGGLILEPTEGRSFGIGNKGNAFCNLKFSGQGGHGSAVLSGQQRAIEKMSLFLSDLNHIRSQWASKYSDNLLGQPTVNITSTKAGDNNAPNVVPAEAECVLDIRVTPKLQEQLKKELDNMALAYGFSYKLPYGITGYGLCGSNSQIYKLAKNSPQTKMEVFEGATDQCFFTEKNIPMLVFGPGEKSQMHKPNEYVKMPNIIKATQIITDLIHNF